MLCLTVSNARGCILQQNITHSMQHRREVMFIARVQLLQQVAPCIHKKLNYLGGKLLWGISYDLFPMVVKHWKVHKSYRLSNANTIYIFLCVCVYIGLELCCIQWQCKLDIIFSTRLRHKSNFNFINIINFTSWGHIAIRYTQPRFKLMYTQSSSYHCGQPLWTVPARTPTLSCIVGYMDPYCHCIFINSIHLCLMYDKVRENEIKKQWCDSLRRGTLFKYAHRLKATSLFSSLFNFLVAVMSPYFEEIKASLGDL